MLMLEILRLGVVLPANLIGLPASIIAGYLILVFKFDLGMRIAYAIVTVAYFAAALLRARLRETLPASRVIRAQIYWVL